jgi:hypothetical protein
MLKLINHKYKNIFTIAAVFILYIPILSNAESKFEQYFIDRTLRVDFFHSGDKMKDVITLDHIYKEGEWSGSLTNLIDPFNNGKYYLKLYDLQSNKLLFSKGYNSYFAEYRTTAKAAECIARTFHETAMLPFPKEKARFTIEARDRNNRLYEIFTLIVDPVSIDIIENRPLNNVVLLNHLINGDIHKKIDLLFVADGYTEGELNKFKKDLTHFSDYLLAHSPYNKFKNRFNIRGLFFASQESGCDEPTRQSYKNTALNTTFNSMGSPRYLLTEENRRLHDLSSNVPYDALLIMVNHKRYGGGGIYNFYLTFTADNSVRDFVFIHEFGHSFAGLADEYYSSTTAYENFYSSGIEPLEPNISALLHSNSLKWQDLVDNGVEIPTFWNKEYYDSLRIVRQKTGSEYQQKISRLREANSTAEEIEKLEKEAEEVDNKYSSELVNIISSKKIGAYEGAGYQSKGMYRSQLNCIMRSSDAESYCKVCEKRIIKMIRYYSE